ncbi:MAG: glycosyl transferase, group 1 [Rhodospirillales bacterium]|nr:glycosyl transferase, group 1 [Rhodospirillales bacterium]
MTDGGASDRTITLLHVFSTFAVGGPQTRFATIADRLGPKYRHLIVSMSGRTEATELLPAQIDYSLVPIHNTPRNPLANAWRFAKQLRQIRPDQLVTYNWGALEWALGNRFGPCLPHIHIEDGFGPDEIVTRFKRRIWLRRVGLARANLIVVPSRNLERIALEEWKFDASRVRYLPNGVDTQRFGASVPEGDRAFEKRPGELIVGTCAALRREKNLARLIRAFAACRPQNARLVICGDGSERAALEAAARANNIVDRVIFTGYLAKPELALAGFDIFAMSSDTEQMPYGLLEAMSAGLPVVSTDVGDIKAIVSDLNRPFIVSAVDEAALTGALRNLMRDPAMRTKLAASNLVKARAEFSIQAMIAAYDRLFGDMSPRRRSIA